MVKDLSYFHLPKINSSTLYSILKRFIKVFIPKELLRQTEPFLRKIYSLFYFGNKVECAVCGNHYSKFIVLKNGVDTLCVNCGSLPRNRLLWMYLSNELNIKTTHYSLLHFSPAKSIKRKLKELKNIEYTTTDYEKGEDKQFDITSINDDDNRYDLIICYHVFEHIVEDAKAMKELFRVLKSGGKALLQVPLKEGDTYEDFSITSPTERLKHFGQDDHVRIYGNNNFEERLKNAGFMVKAVPYATKFSDETIVRNGLNKQELIFVCTKK